jgi:hypothetical protein
VLRSVVGIFVRFRAPLQPPRPDAKSDNFRIATTIKPINIDAIVISTQR